MTILLSF